MSKKTAGIMAALPPNPTFTKEPMKSRNTVP